MCFMRRKLKDRYHHPKARKILFDSLALERAVFIGEIMAFVLQDDQQVTVTVVAVDKHGHATTLVGTPVWADATGQCTLTPSADGMSCLIVPNDMGTTQINVTADGISGVLDLEVVAGTAVAFTLNPGTPEAQP